MPIGVPLIIYANAPGIRSWAWDGEWLEVTMGTTPDGSGYFFYNWFAGQLDWDDGLGPHPDPWAAGDPRVDILYSAEWQIVSGSGDVEVSKDDFATSMPAQLTLGITNLLWGDLDGQPWLPGRLPSVCRRRHTASDGAGAHRPAIHAAHRHAARLLLAHSRRHYRLARRQQPAPQRQGEVPRRHCCALPDRLRQSGAAAMSLDWADTNGQWADYRYSWIGNLWTEPPRFRLRIIMAGFDVSQFVLADAVTMHRGRANASEQPDPSTCVFIARSSPVAPRVGMPVRAMLETERGGERVHFAGRVSDIDATMIPGASNLRVTCTSEGLGKLARNIIGDIPWPTESDSARIRRILDAAGAEIGTIDPGVFTLNARDVDAQDALRLVSDYPIGSMTMLVDERDGKVSWHSAKHRDGKDPLTLPAQIIDGESYRPSLSAKVGGILNRIKVRYGVAPEGGEQPEFLVEDAESIADFGRYERSLTTELGNVTNAQAVAETLLAQYREARYKADSMTLRIEELSLNDQELVEQIEPAQPLWVAGMPLPAPDPWHCWVEGVTDVFTNATWLRTLRLDDFDSAPADVEPPLPPTGCGGFDWDLSCSTERLVPFGLQLVKDFQALPGPGTSWDDDLVRFSFDRVTRDDGLVSFVGVVSMGSWLVGTSTQPHPIRSSSAAATIRTSASRGRSAGTSIPAGKCKTRAASGGHRRAVCSVISCEWVPAVGWPEFADIHADGFVSATTFPGTAGATRWCRRRRWADVATPGKTRVSTLEPGRFQVGGFFFISHPTAGDFALGAPVRTARPFTALFHPGFARAIWYEGEQTEAPTSWPADYVPPVNIRRETVLEAARRQKEILNA